MLRALIWIVMIVAIAVGLTLLARHSTGYVLVVSPPYRVELSLNFLLLLLGASFVLFYFIVRMITATVRLPGRVGEYRAARRRRKARAILASALREYFAGRYVRAEKAAQRALDMGEQPDLSAVLAARAAHGLRAYERRDDYLARAAATAGGDEPMRVVTEAELLLEQRRSEEALDMLKRLRRRHTAALRLELEAQQQLRNWDQALALVNELQRRKVFDADQAMQIRRVALVENLRRKALDVKALEEAWQKVPVKDRTDGRIAAAAARCFIELEGCAQAHRIVEEALESSWDSDIVALYAECDADDALRRIERAESWLKSYPRDAVLLLTLGRLCVTQELWGKAQSYLEASIAVEPTYSAHLALAGLYEKLGNMEAVEFHQSKGLTLALSQLKTATHGRRRAPL